MKIKPSYQFRRVLPSDKDELLKISAKVWEGHDWFIPTFFDEWAKDEKGEFTAVLLDNKLIGCSKLTFLTPTDAWLQGLRKDIDLDLKGVGEAVTRYYVEKLKHYHNLTSIRFSSYWDTPGSIRPAERIGFRVFKALSWKHLFFKPENLKPRESYKNVERIDNFKEIKAFFKKSSYFKHTDNLVNLGWEVHPYSDRIIKQAFIKKGNCFGLRIDGELKALALIYFERSPVLAFFDADNILNASDLIDYLKHIAVEKEKRELQIYLPDDGKLLRWFGTLGFFSWERNHDFLIYEYPVENLK